MTTTTTNPESVISKILPPPSEKSTTKIGQSLTQMAWRRLRRDKLTLLAIGVVLLMAIISFTAPLTTQWLNISYTDTNASITFLPIGSPGHILGTDDLGRDHLARLMYAGQVSLSVGFVAAAISLLIGISLGIIAGYYGGIADDLINWVITTLDSIPGLFLLLLVAAAINNLPIPSRDTPPVAAWLINLFKNGPAGIILVLGLIGWTGTARIVRGETLSLREREFIVSARTVGASPVRIMASHILPNLFSVIVITMAISIGSLILVEAALSFLGLGIKPPTPSWGNMLTKAQEFFTKGAHLVVLPGLLIFITVLCLYVTGDGLRDAFDPTSKD